MGIFIFYTISFNKFLFSEFQCLKVILLFFSKYYFSIKLSSPNLLLAKQLHKMGNFNPVEPFVKTTKAFYL